MESRPQHEENDMLHLTATVICPKENSNGKFAFAEPNCGGTWPVFREQSTGTGPKTFVAELVNQQGKVIKIAVHSNMDHGRIIRFNRMQIHNQLRKDLGLL